MVRSISPRWTPTKIRRVAHCHDTGSEVVELMSDAGPGYAKFLGGREGPHVLACEFIGTRLAELIGLPTFEYALLPYDGIPQITLHHGGRAEIGPAWITRKEEGIQWSGRAEDLADVENQDDLALLVLLDLWTLNCDRYRPAHGTQPARSSIRNVFLSRLSASAGKLRLIAMDHTHTFTCGRPLSPTLAHINQIQDTQRYGLFPGFVEYVTWPRAKSARQRLEAATPDAIRQIVTQVPREWQVDTDATDALIRFLIQRRDWLLGTFPALIFDQSELFA